ncbi:MAG: Holliday junction resolvase RuvX [Clostridiaceae bacterium]|jgi:putative Holliday junction resolvase|nr:Holliday junction resolvase RuvX [Clostridiaceae bacterium]
MRILCIDYGDARIGVAVSDPLGLTAQMLETIKWKNDIQRPVQRIKEIYDGYNCEAIVVGIPRNMDGTAGPREIKTREFIKLLETELPEARIVPWDERLTTVMAQRAMHDMGIVAKNQKSRIDQMAAAFILQGYLDSIR